MSAAATRPEDDAGLAGKVAIIAGGGAAGDGIGNGRAAAILLARAGTKVLVVDREGALAERTVAMIAGEGGTAAAHQADLTDPAQARDMVTAALDRFGRLDFLDNNVGIGSRGSVVDETPENWRRVMQVNVEPMFLAAKYAIPAMIKTAKRGAIVNISSISALRPRGLTVYSASKGAVIALTRAMAVDHAKDGIRVNCITPGPVYTPMVYARGMSPASARHPPQGLRARHRGHRLGHRPRRALPAVGPRALHHRPHAGGGRRGDAASSRTREPGTLNRTEASKEPKPMARVPYLDKSDLAPENQELLKRNITLHRALANSPNGLRAFGALGNFIRHKSRLDPRLRELAILQVGYLARAPYEWSHHVKIGRDFGVTDDDIRALIAETEGESSKLEPLAKLVLKSAREMTNDLADLGGHVRGAAPRTSTTSAWSISSSPSRSTTRWCACWAACRSTSSPSISATSRSSRCPPPARANVDGRPEEERRPSRVLPPPW